MASSPEDDERDSGEDIPFKKPDSKAVKDEVDDEEEDDEEDEYVVEKLISHKFTRGKGILYEVKWVGWDSEANTMEPEENLTGCPEELKAYFKSIGGRPKLGIGKSTPGKRTAGDTATSTPNSSVADGKRSHKRAKTGSAAANGDDSKTSIATGGKATWKAPPGSWEDHVVGVHTIERDVESGELYAFIEWDNGHKSRHPNHVLHLKCPQKLLTYFEAHLFFYPNEGGKDGDDDLDPTKTKDKSQLKMRAAIESRQNVKQVASKPETNDVEMDVGEDEDEDMGEDEGIKKVASAA